MTRDALMAQIGGIADAVRSDWRWVQDDLNVQVLVMLLHGLAAAIAHANDLAPTDVDAAVFGCLTERIGAAPKWSAGCVAEARAAADDEAHHPAERELIDLGHTYYGVERQDKVIENIYANFASVRRASGFPEQLVTVFLNPLAMLLAAREKQKGSALTEAEVLEIRDGAACMRMPLAQAEKFYESLDAQSPIPRLNPEQVWEQWQLVRDRLSGS